MTRGLVPNWSLGEAEMTDATAFCQTPIPTLLVHPVKNECAKIMLKTKTVLRVCLQAGVLLCLLGTELGQPGLALSGLTCLLSFCIEVCSNRGPAASLPLME